MNRDRILIVKAELRGKLFLLIRTLGIAGFRASEWGSGKIYPLNPTRRDRHPGSFVIWTAPGDGQGAWKDYATGEAGDVLDLVAYVKGSLRGEALRWAENFCGIKSWDVAERPRPARIARDERLEAEKAVRALEKKRRQAFALWLKAEEDIAGTPIEAYQASRGLDLGRFKRRPRALRYLPDHRHRESGRLFPCMIALMSGADGRPAGIHRTWVAPDGSGKAPVKPVRKMWPSLRGTGAHIRLSKGADNLSPEEAARHGVIAPVVLIEGIEDGLQIVQALPDLRVWACGSLAGFLEVPNLPCVDAWLIVKDNDWGKPEAKKLLERGLDRIHRFGKPYHIGASPVGKDLTDLSEWAKGLAA